MYKLLANVLRAIHIAIVALIIVGVIVWFFFPNIWISACTSTAVLLEAIGLKLYNGECPLTVWEHDLRKKYNPNLPFKKLIPEILKHFIPSEFLPLAYKIMLRIGLSVGIIILLQLILAIIMA